MGTKKIPSPSGLNNIDKAKSVRLFHSPHPTSFMFYMTEKGQTRKSAPLHRPHKSKGQSHQKQPVPYWFSGKEIHAVWKHHTIVWFTRTNIVNLVKISLPPIGFPAYDNDE